MSKKNSFAYFETDDSCAICGIRGYDNLTLHHIDGKKNVDGESNNDYDNLIVLCHIVN